MYSDGEWCSGSTKSFDLFRRGSNPRSPVKMPRYTEQELRKAVLASCNYKQTLENLSLRAAGGNYLYLYKWIKEWSISTNHFETHKERKARSVWVINNTAKPLVECLVENSTYCRSHLKARLYREGHKQRVCEMCGQNEVWQGKRIGLILDHINGVYNDNRIENLRIVCPNCNATLDTHCGKHKRTKLRDAKANRPKADRGKPRSERRKVERPPYDQLLQEIEQTNYSAVGRKYGVSDNAIRKWTKMYEKTLGIGGIGRPARL